MNTFLRKASTGAAALALSSVLIFTGLPAHADPTTVDDAQAQLATLEEQASQLDSQFTAVQEKLDKGIATLAQATADLDAQAGKVASLKAQVGQVALQQWRGRGVDTTTQLFVTEDIDTFLSQLSTVQKVTQNTNALLQNFQAGQANLADMRRSSDAEVAAITADRAKLAEVKVASDAKVKAAEDLLAKLTDEQRKKLAEQQAAAAAARAATIAQQEAAQTVSRTATRAPQPAATKAPAPAPAPFVGTGEASSRAQGAVAFALSQVGKAYVMGATGPNAYDCSGLTSSAYRSAGVSIPRTSQAQYGAGTRVGLSELQPGDLVFYYSGISHVGIYIGGGRIVHAANPRSGVNIASVTSMPFMGGRRVA